MRPIAVVLACLALAGCAERSLGIDEPITDEGGLCGTERACKGTGAAPFAQKGVCTSERGTVQIEATAVDVAFCHCMHGCGPGIDGAITMRVRNRSRRAVVLDWAEVRYVGDDGRTFVDRREGCCTPGLRRDYRCEGETGLFIGALAPGAVDDVVIAEHFDTDGVAPGRYAVEVRMLVDGKTQLVDAGEVMVPDGPACS